MPSYSYTVWDEDGNRVTTVERVFPMHRHPRTIRVDGQVAVRDVAADWERTPTVKCWEPGNRIPSEALAIHPDQVEGYKKYDKAMGVPTEYVANRAGMLTPDFTSRSHRKRYGRAHRVHDRDGGYGDA
jgi:hypothetical protein